MERRRVVLLSDENLLDERRTSSVAIRQLYLAGRLSKSHQVTIASTQGSRAKSRQKEVTILTGVSDLYFIARQFDVVVVSLSSSRSSIAYRYAESSGGLPLVVDSYFALLFEKLVSLPSEPVVAEKLQVIRMILNRADHLVVATPRQRDYWLGWISSLGKINSASFGDELISVVPTLPEVSFSKRKTSRLRKGVLGRDAKIVVWLGGVHPWFNPLPLVKAMPAVIREEAKARLVIVGGKHPLAGFEAPYQKVLAAVDKTGLSRQEIVMTDWVSKEQSFAYCAEADVSVVLTKPTLEDEFSFRTRTVTPLLLRVPVVTNGKDYLSELIGEYQAGLVCRSSRPGEIARVIGAVLADEGKRSLMAANTRRLLSQIKRDTDEQPLKQFLDQPRRARPVSWGRLESLKFRVSGWLR